MKERYFMAFKKMVPFVKRAGGKNQLIDKLHARLPNSYDTYYELFIGGGTLLLNERLGCAVISDVNEQFIKGFLLLVVIGISEVALLGFIEYILPGKIVTKFVEQYII